MVKITLPVYYLPVFLCTKPIDPGESRNDIEIKCTSLMYIFKRLRY